jgi:hypothetical protein
MENKNNIFDNLENETPFLDKIKKENHFSTPKNYFENLPNTISNRITNDSPLFTFKKLSYRIALPILAIFVIVFLVTNFNTEQPQLNLNNEQISNLVIDENYIEIDDYIIYETYSEIIEPEKESEEYIDYLVENDIHINTIVDEL